MKAILPLLIAMLLLMPAIAQAKYCVNESWEGEHRIFDGEAMLMERYCPHGCLNDACFGGSILNIFILLFSVGIAFILMFARRDPIINVIGSLTLITISAILFSQGIVYDDLLIKNTMTHLLAFVFLSISIYKLYASALRFYSDRKKY